MIDITLEIISLIREHNTEGILSKAVNTHCIIIIDYKTESH